MLGSDFSVKHEVLRFGACEKRQCITIPILDDNIVEDTESFSIHLEKSLGLSNRFMIDPGVKVINITDNDGMFPNQGSMRLLPCAYIRSQSEVTAAMLVTIL